MTNDHIQISKTNYAEFDNDIIVDTLSSMPIGASQSGLARIVNCNRSSLQNYLNSVVPKIIVLELEIHTPTGLRRCQVVPFSAFKQVFVKFNPSLLEAASDYGIAAYTLNLAGYKVETKAPTVPTQPQFEIPKTLGEALLLAGELSNKLDIAQAKIEADSEATALGEYLNKGEGLVGIGEMARVLNTGRTRYFVELREMGIMMKDKRIPYQSFIESGYFLVTETLTNDRNIVMVTLVTPKGQLYLAKRHKQFLANEWMIARVEREVNLI